MNRYNVITEKNPREILLLRGTGCIYRQCTFCDYHTDCSPDRNANYALNDKEIQKITGCYHNLEVINSGSVFELDADTLLDIQIACNEKGIHTVHFESHYLYRHKIPALRRRFIQKGIALKMKLGLETFDYHLREDILHKGIPEHNPAVIAEHFEEANLLFGIDGQTVESMQQDITLGLAHFERICINIMCENTTAVKPDPSVINAFRQHLYPRYKDDPRIDILMHNTDFGVGD